MTAHSEEKALDALIAITLRAGINSDVSEADIKKHMANPQMNAEELAAYEKWKATAAMRIAGKLSDSPVDVSFVKSPAFAAMNRKNEKEKHDPATEEELKRLRKQLLGEEEQPK